MVFLVSLIKPESTTKIELEIKNPIEIDFKNWTCDQLLKKISETLHSEQLENWFFSNKVKDQSDLQENQASIIFTTESGIPISAKDTLTQVRYRVSKGVFF